MIINLNLHVLKSSPFSLIKMMYFIFQKNGNQKLTMNQLLHCLRRNFGGKSNVTETIDMFLENVSVKELRTEEITCTSDDVCNCNYFMHV